MINSTITRKISAAFLATILVAGIIALSYPSFMVGAQAEPEYGMDSYDKKSYGKDSDESSDDAKDSDESSDDAKDSDESSDDAKDSDELEYGTDSYDKKAYGNDDYGTQYSSYGKDNSYKSKDSNSVTVKKIKCNNINVNVNGLELNLTSVPFLSGLLGFEAQASDEGYSGASSYESGEGIYGDEKSGSDKSFKFICINNNNNTVIGNGDGNGDGNGNGNGDQCDDIIECLESTGEEVTFPITITNPGGQNPTIINDIDELCEFLSEPPQSVSAEQLLRVVAQILPDATEEEVETIVCNCLVPLFGIQGACPPGPQA
jgi:hypothetical protein